MMNRNGISGLTVLRAAFLSFFLLPYLAGCQSGVKLKGSEAPDKVSVNHDESQPRILEPVRNADHVDPGIALDKTSSPFYPSRARTDASGGVISIDRFDPPETCGACHQEIYAQWKGSMHSNAWNDPIYRALMQKASAATGGLTDNLCIGCHTPQGLTTGEATPTGERMSEISRNGVYCEFCHNVSAATGIGNAAYVLTPRKFGRPLKFGPFKDARSPYHDTVYSELHTTSAMCGMCHNATHPLSRVPIERTYDEWKDSPYAAEGIGCQECHMTPGPGYTKNPGRAAIGGPERDHIYSHYFVGGNVLVPRMLGSEKHAELAAEMLRGAASMELLSAEHVRPGGLATVKIRVHNVGAGHKLPTGFPEGREMWVDFRVTDGGGRELYRLGRIGEDGFIEKGTHVFRVALGDKDGRIIDVEVWNATSILYDTRILPRGYADVTFTFPVPADSKGAMTIKADLCYHSFPQAVVDHLLGAEAPVVPTVIMTSLSGKIEL